MPIVRLWVINRILVVNCWHISVFLSVAQREAVMEPAAVDSSNRAAATSDGFSDKSRPVFNVGDDEMPSSAGESAETVVSDVSAVSDAAAAAVAGNAVKLSAPKPPDTTSTPTTSLMHKSASKYATATLSCLFSSLNFITF